MIFSLCFTPTYLYLFSNSVGERLQFTFIFYKENSPLGDQKAEAERLGEEKYEALWGADLAGGAFDRQPEVEVIHEDALCRSIRVTYVTGELAGETSGPLTEVFNKSGN